jgi:hypothetical protein
MRLYHLFPTVKTAALHLASIKNYSKNTHAPFILKWAIMKSSSFNVFVHDSTGSFNITCLTITTGVYRVGRNISPPLPLLESTDVTTLYYAFSNR